MKKRGECSFSSGWDKQNSFITLQSGNIWPHISTHDAYHVYYRLSFLVWIGKFNLPEELLLLNPYMIVQSALNTSIMECLLWLFLQTGGWVASLYQYCCHRKRVWPEWKCQSELILNNPLQSVSCSKYFHFLKPHPVRPNLALVVLDGPVSFSWTVLEKAPFWKSKRPLLSIVRV